MPRESVRLLRKHNRELEVVGGDLAISEIIDDLGVLPIIGKLAIFVEGENDRQFLLAINNIPELNKIIDISKIAIIPLGGSILERWVKRNYLDGSNITEFHLYDKDADEKYKLSIEKINNRGDSSKGVLTTSREIENYIHPTLVECFDKFSGLSCDSIRSNWSIEDIPKFVSSKSKIDESVVKQIMCCSLSNKMTKKLFEDIGVWDEVSGWFNTIKELVEKSR